MTSCTYGMPRSACSVALETYRGAFTIILRILDWLLRIIDILDLLAQPHNSKWDYNGNGVYRHQQTRALNTACVKYRCLHPVACIRSGSGVSV
jgi:hypothetical protein